MVTKTSLTKQEEALRAKYSGWVPQHELDKLDGIPAHAVKATEAIAERFAPEQTDLEEAVEAAPKRPRKLKVVDAE